jgi:transcriptional regulator with XRE-family HTH domain
MDTLVYDPTAAIARRIRLEREARQWSLADLAEHSRVSKGAINKIERGDTSPTAVVLVKLAGAFGLTLAGLLTRAESMTGRVTRPADQPRWQDPSSGYTRRQILAQPDHPVELVEVELPAGKQVALPASSYALIRQAVWVLAGTLSVAEGGEQHRLAAGDCLAFGPPSDVTFANDTPEPCRYLVALARS